MKNRRNDLDICADILRVSQMGALKTQIVYQANVNFKIVKGHLKRMIDHGLLKHDPPKYYATPKGVMYLMKFENLISFRGPEADSLVTPVTEGLRGG